MNREVPVGYPAREIALERILAQAMRFPDLDIAPFDPRIGTQLDARDAALARAIEYAVVRRYLTLIACIRPHLAKNWPMLEKPVQAALLAGAAQILFLDRVPAAAAVDASVEWTKRRLRPGAGGLVNAVLRKVAGSVAERIPASETCVGGAMHEMVTDHTLRNIVPLSDGGALRLTLDAFGEDSAAAISEKTSHARELILHWIGAFGFKETQRIALHDLVDAPLIITPYDAADPRLAERVTAHNDAGFGVWNGSHAELTTLLDEIPGLRVQDPTAASTVQILSGLPREPKVIVDLCAGRGTKTRQLAQMFPNATIFATDPEESRFAALVRMRDRYPNMRVLGPELLFREAAGKADLLLLDVPCSNSGVLARRPEARYRFTKGRTKSVIELQQKICDPAIGLLAAKGAVLYATCSIEHAENEAQARRLSNRHELSPIVDRTVMPTGMPGEPPSSYRDGGFHALLAKA
ncbi:MAG: Ribosomal small subunit methyltransferase [Planctomycetota bacterium]